MSIESLEDLLHEATNPGFAVALKDINAETPATAVDENKQDPELKATKGDIESSSCEDTAAVQQEKLYSAFTDPQKKWIVIIAGMAGWFSTTSSFIYFPAIPFLAHDLGVSIEYINLTVTSYLIASGIFPSIVGSAADYYGRRSVFIVALAVYVAVNVGLALQSSFAALVTLRMVQSAAIAGTYSFVYGVLGDLTTPADRGGYIGFTSVFLNTPPAVAPMISGLLLIRWEWRAIFWFLTIASSTVLLVIVFFLPETCRRIVGNGSLVPSTINRPIIPVLTVHKKTASEETGSSGLEAESVTHTNAKRAAGGLQIFNPFNGLALIFKHKGTAVVVVCFGAYYTTTSCLQASLSTKFIDVYNVSGLVAGLCYIPFGVASIVASSFTGKLLDYDYKRTARGLGITADRKKEGDLSDFPIEYARLRTSKLFLILCAPLLVGYGWALQARVHIAVPLVLQFWIGFTNQSLNALLVDFHPDKPATIQAANNLIRCEMAAGGLALLEPMLRGLGGPGWCFVVFACLHFATFPALWILERHGLVWRKDANKQQGERCF